MAMLREIVHSLTFLCAVLCWSQSSINWICVNNTQCRRVIGPASDNKMSMEACQLTCGGEKTLWPNPTGDVTISKELVSVLYNPANILVRFKDRTGNENECRATINKLRRHIFGKLLAKRFAKRVKNSLRGSSFVIVADIENPSMNYSLDTYEGYLLEKKESGAGKVSQVQITAENYYGYRNALVTLLQLMNFDPLKESVVMPKSFRITDEPKYPIRSVMIDTGHNFMDIDSMKHLIDGLALGKINTVHWHISDWHSFPLQASTDSRLAEYGTYSGGQTYTPSDVSSLVDYAKMHGVRIIPEIPIPGRMGSGWQWGPDAGLGDLVVCFNRRPYRCKEPPCGQLNIENSEAVKLAEKLYEELPSMFGDGVYHLGGADVDIQCWTNLSATQAYELWAILLNKVADGIISKGGQVIIFSNELLNDSRQWLSPEKFIIQVTEQDPAYARQLMSKGYRVILSPENRTRWDCGLNTWSPAVKKLCTRILGWQAAYDIPTRKKLGQFYPGVLGAEGLLYSEGTHGFNTEERLLLNGAGLAGRFWGDPGFDYLGAIPGMYRYSSMMNDMGFNNGAMAPLWCLQNVGSC